MNRLGLLIACLLLVPVSVCVAQDEQEKPARAETEREESTPVETADELEESTPVFPEGSHFQSAWPPTGHPGWVDYTSPSPPPPTWTFQAEALFLQRNQKFGGPLALREPAQSVIMDGGDLDFEFEPGFRLLFGYRNRLGNLEASYRGFFEWSDFASVNGDNDVSAPGDLSLAAFDFFAADFISAEYVSEMQDMEVNQFFSLTREGPVDTEMMDGDHLDMLVGVRALLLDEEFRLTATDIDTGDRSLYRVRTDNHLIGGQIGLRYTIRQAPWFFQSQAKIGLYGNPNQQKQQVTDLNIPLLLRDERDKHTNAAVIAELEFALGYEVRPNITLRAGYLLTWVEGISRAPDQLDFTNTATSGSVVNDSGSFLAHGLTIGVIFTRP